MLPSYRLKSPFAYTFVRHGIERVEMVSHIELIPLKPGQEPSDSDNARELPDKLFLPAKADVVALAVQLHGSDLDASVALAFNRAAQRAEDYFFHLEMQKPPEERHLGELPAGRAFESMFTAEELGWA